MKLASSFLSSLILGNFATTTVLAQVTPDGTTSTTVTPTATGFEINNGDVAGGNIFHSFGEFSVPAGGEAFFDNADSISNIFSRVTGGNISNIDGILRANGTANLFLINPAGIVFGEGASLQLGGSFYGSTADNIVFPDGEFSATDLDNPPLITINAPIGLGFRDNPGDIVNRSKFEQRERIGLQVNRGNIALIGGNVLVENSGVSTTGGTITLGGLSQAGIVEMKEEGSFNFPVDVDKADISFDNSAIISEIREESYGEIGDINFTADSISLNNSFILSDISDRSSGEVGDINFTSGSIYLNDFSLILSDITNRSSGEVGDINFTADSISLNDNFLILSWISDRSSGKLGDINFTADSISLNDDSLIISNIREESSGKLGDINFTADSISLNDSSIVSEIREGSFEVNPGGIFIDTDYLYINSNNTDNEFRNIGASISSTTSTNEQAANLSINVKELTQITGLNSNISSSTNGEGDAGNIEIDTKRLELLNGAQIAVNNFVTENIEILPGGVIKRTILDEPRIGFGNAGTIDIIAENITLDNVGGITALSTAGEGGNINLTATELLTLKNFSEISTAAGLEDTPGSGGDINIDAELILAYPNTNSDIKANAFEGSGGNITINAEGVLGLEERDLNPVTNDINASSQLGLSGSININTPDTNPLRETTEVSGEIVDREIVTAATACDAKDIDDVSGLVVNGKGGVPPLPTEPFNDYPIITKDDVTTTKNPVGTIPATRSESFRGTSLPDGNANNFDRDYIPPHIKPVLHDNGEPLYAARGLIVKPDGGIILTAYPTPGTPGYRDYQQQIGCDVN